MSRATDMQRYIEQVMGRGLRTAVVTRVHGVHVDVQVGGSSRYLRTIPVMGGMPGIGQEVILLEADGSIYAQSLTPPKDQLTSTSVDGGAGVITHPGEGPGIDVVGTTVVGLGGDTILLYDSGGSPVAEHAAGDAGVDAASAAAAAGDVIWLPAVTISGDHTLTAGVHYIGLSRWASILTGQITFGDGTTLEKCTVARTANDGNDLKGIIAPGSGAAKVSDCDVTCTQAGAGNAFAVAVEGSGDLECWHSYLNGDSSGGAGYGGYHGIGQSGNLYVYTSRVIGSTAAFNE